MTKSNSDTSLLKELFPQPDPSLNLYHLRRFAKPAFLPTHLNPLGEDENTSVSNPTIHLLVTPPPPNPEDLTATLSPYLPDAIPITIRKTQIPIYPPRSAQQALEWSAKYWPCTYNPAAHSAAHSPPPHLLSKTLSELNGNAGEYFALARYVADEAASSGRGRGVGAVIVDPEAEKRDGIVTVAGDARWSTHSSANVVPEGHREERQGEGRPEQHALIRAVALVAEKRLSLVSLTHPQSATSKSTGGPPLSELETYFYNRAENPLPTRAEGGYLCTGLDVYITHEPCVCCAMGMVHSRFRAVAVDARGMMKVGHGGLSVAEAEIVPDNDGDVKQEEGIDKSAGGTSSRPRGYGLHWRKELNWRVLGFQFIDDGDDEQDKCSGLDAGNPSLESQQELFHA